MNEFHKIYTKNNIFFFYIYNEKFGVTIGEKFHSF